MLSNRYSGQLSAYLQKYSINQYNHSSIDKSGIQSFRTRKINMKSMTEVVMSNSLNGPYQPSSGDQNLVLYGHPLCPYVERAWICLEEKGLPYSFVHVDLSNKPSWYGDLNPRKLVPSLVVDGQVVVESLDIIKYVASLDGGNRLEPASSDAKADHDEVFGLADKIVSAGISLMTGGTARRWGIGNQADQADAANLNSLLEKLSQMLEKYGGPYLFGKKATMADAAILPFVRRFSLVGRRQLNYELPKDIQKWIDFYNSTESGQVTHFDEDLFAQAAITKHSSLDFFDYDTYNPADIHPHLQKLLV